MLKADIIMRDGTELNDVMLFTSQHMSDSQILTKTVAEEYLHSDRSVFFGGKYVQGWFIPKQVSTYLLYEDNETIEKNVKEFVKNNGGVYDTNDTADFIIEYRDELLKLLK